MNQQLAVAARRKAVAARLELATMPLEVVKLSIDDGADPPRLIGDGLPGAGGVHDGESGVCESDPRVRRGPDPVAVGSTMLHGMERALESLTKVGRLSSDHRGYPAHARSRSA